MGDRRDAPGGADGAAVFKQPYAESVFPVLLPLLKRLLLSPLRSLKAFDLYKITLMSTLF